MNKVVLAYSGGLDTSVAVAWLQEQFGVEVVTLTVDLGGGSLREGVERRAISAGATKAYVVDARERFVTDFVWPLLQAGALYQGVYPLATALARPLIRASCSSKWRSARARTRSRMAAPARATTRSVSTWPFTRWIRASRSSLRCASEWAFRATRRSITRLPATSRSRSPKNLAVLHRRQPLGPKRRDRRPRGSVGLAAGRRVRMDGRSGRGAGSGRSHDRVRGRHPGRARRRASRSGGARRSAVEDRRRPRCRADRPRRGSARRHQEP